MEIGTILNSLKLVFIKKFWFNRQSDRKWALHTILKKQLSMRYSNKRKTLYLYISKVRKPKSSVTTKKLILCCFLHKTWICHSYSSLRSTFSLIQISLTLTALSGPFIKGIDEENLPFPGWQSYNITSSTIFWSTYVYQGIFFVLCSVLLVAHEAMFSGLLLHIFAQANLIKHRITTLLESKKANHSGDLVLVIRNHVSIYR